MKKLTAKPFIKWVGGKNQLLGNMRGQYPENVPRYCEPFVGGGAVLFDILQRFCPDEVLINDINSELINCYRQIKYNVSALISRLDLLQKEYMSLDTVLRKELYGKKRNEFNTLIVNETGAEEQRAALFIFLNKTCFNGLYHVNSKGFFNVPCGIYKNPLICDCENLTAVSRLLKKVEIICGDYKNCADFIDGGTFVYADPPYRPLTATASFTSYAASCFGDKEQTELSEFVSAITKKGAKVVVSNSDPKNIDVKDNFFDDLYCGYSIKRVSAKRMINSDSAKRGSVSELLISNY